MVRPRSRSRFVLHANLQPGPLPGRHLKVFALSESPSAGVAGSHPAEEERRKCTSRTAAGRWIRPRRGPTGAGEPGDAAWRSQQERSREDLHPAPEGPGDPRQPGAAGGHPRRSGSCPDSISSRPVRAVAGQEVHRAPLSERSPHRRRLAGLLGQRHLRVHARPARSPAARPSTTRDRWRRSLPGGFESAEGSVDPVRVAVRLGGSGLEGSGRVLPWICPGPRTRGSSARRERRSGRCGCEEPPGSWPPGLPASGSDPTGKGIRRPGRG